MTEPKVSVVVPAHNARALLPRLFAALDRTTFADAWEVVVVDDASTDATAEVAAEWGARIVRLDSRSGPARARNAGIAAARAPLIAFTDADCEPSPEWLSALTGALAAADVATGPVRPAAEAPPFARTLSIARESPLFQTANLAVRREVVERVGGFEPFTPIPGVRTGLRPRVEEGHFGEDVVFGWRARRTGARTVFVDDALVRHAVFPRSAHAYVGEHWRRRFFPALVREVPELRSALPLRIFLTRESALFDLAVAGLGVALALRRRGPLIAALPYLRHRLTLRGAWRASVARRNLTLVAADAVGFAALVRGSVAARRLLL